MELITTHSLLHRAGNAVTFHRAGPDLQVLGVLATAQFVPPIQNKRLLADREFDPPGIDVVGVQQRQVSVGDRAN